MNIQDDMKNNPFLYAGAEGYLDILKLTIEAGADPTITNRYGGTVLLEAIVLNDGNARQQETIQLLIDHGADVNIPDRDGVSPLSHARNKGFKEIEDILVRAGAK